MGFDKSTARQAGSKSSRKGRPNKATSDLRKVVADLLDGNAEKIAKDIESLDPKDRVSAWLKLLEFSLPKLNRTQAELTADTAHTEVRVIITADDLRSDPIE